MAALRPDFSMKPSPLLAPAGPSDGLTDVFGGRYYRIARNETLPTFFMNVVSASDLWLFLASNGGLTAGRINPEHALFPYLPVDKIYDSAAHTGPVTALWVRRNGQPVLWEPFAGHTGRLYTITRCLYKSLEGDRVWFEETNHDLALTFRYGWSTAADHGLIRRSELENLGARQVSVRLLDGLRNLLPPGVHLSLQSTSSSLVDAYKTAESLPDSPLALYSLAADITDRPLPVESLRTAAVWSEGLPGARILLSETQFPHFLAGGTPTAESRRRGIRQAYALTTEIVVAPRATQRWVIVADTNLSHADVAARCAALARGPQTPGVLAAADASSRLLRSLVAAADGLQAGAAETTTAHHFANVLFNIMRGGLFATGYTIPAEDFAGYLRIRHRAMAERHAALLAALPDPVGRADLLARAAATGDADLERLALEYLPLTFSRRHGDPSRPWNRFHIRVRDQHGRRVLAHEGNWRDIFQNWEALCLSYPDYFESIIAKFVNASTADGYNPYRVTHAGFNWEEPEPGNPWASIGYWGDHQTIYLLKLLEWSGRFHPGLLHAWLRRALFSYANVPYRIAGYAALCRDPRNTILFDAAKHHAIEESVAQLGADARLIRRPDGSVLHVNLAEKLLLLVLTRLTNFVPGGGIWMNTQRPDWNDANNALVGYGVSLVTLCYLRRFLAHLDREIMSVLGDAPLPVSAPLVPLATKVLSALESHRGLLDSPEIAAVARRGLVDALGAAGSDYRETIYRDGPGTANNLAPEQFRSLVRLALKFVDHTLRANRRPDGLFHSYNVLEFAESPARLELLPLPLMLEGQVAVLSSGLLAPAEAAGLLEALRHSPLYRADQHSYLLYPDRELPGFLDRNHVPGEAVDASPLLHKLLAAGDPRLVLKDATGRHRFHPDIVNHAALAARLAELGAEPRWQRLVRDETPQLHEIFERVFHHRAFTGRSGTMFGYEGLGCIYWHMVTKLLLAAQENLELALAASDQAAPRLTVLYHDIRSGLGFNKSPAAYGAFPTDPYSHTPGHSGAQQPGMTGQVKEEILTRNGELGVTIAQGRLGFAPAFLLAGEFITTPVSFTCFNLAEEEISLELPPGSLAFTVFGVPVIYHCDGGDARIVVHNRDSSRAIAGSTLDQATSARLFARDGSVTHLEVHLGAAYQPCTATG
jgi:hypothetical protein